MKIAARAALKTNVKFSFLYYNLPVTTSKKGYKMKKLIVVSGAAALLAGSLFAADGATLYKKCAACHGPKAEKVYLNKVPALNTLSKEEIAESLKGYKAGTLDKFKSAAMMKPIAKPLSDDDIAALSEYIPTLK